MSKTTHNNISEVIRILGQLEGKMDNIALSLKDHTDRMNRIDEDVEDVRKDIVVVKAWVTEQLDTTKKDIATVDKKIYGVTFSASVVWAIIVVLSGIIGYYFTK